MAKQTQEPGPGRPTPTASFDALRKEIAKRNEEAQQKARKVRSAREHEQVVMRRRWDAL